MSAVSPNNVSDAAIRGKMAAPTTEENNSQSMNESTQNTNEGGVTRVVTTELGENMSILFILKEAFTSFKSRVPTDHEMRIFQHITISNGSKWTPKKLQIHPIQPNIPDELEDD